MTVVDRSFDNPMLLEENASMALAGGINNLGYQCGMLWGAALAAGAQTYRLFGMGPQAEAAAVVAAQKLVASFGARNKNEINCLEITDLNMQGKIKVAPLLKFLFKGGPIGCFRMAAGYAPEAFKEIETALSDMEIVAPSPPVSCSSMLAKKMGASDQHTVMVAGLAGGIGLSGGACGALGTAIWIIGMNGRKEEAGSKVIGSRIGEIIDRFVKSKYTDFEFECSKITGRKFDNVGDHAEYLHEGGCSELIDLLAVETSEGKSS